MDALSYQSCDHGECIEKIDILKMSGEFSQQCFYVNHNILNNSQTVTEKFTKLKTKVNYIKRSHFLCGIFEKMGKTLLRHKKTAIFIRVWLSKKCIICT